MTITIDTKMKWVRMCTVRTALGLEIKGMRRSRSPSAYMVAKNVYGLKGNRQSVYDQLEAIIKQKKEEMDKEKRNVPVYE